MSTDSSSTKPEPKPITPEVHHIQRVVIFQYPKVVFLLPSMITALIAGLFMAFLGIDLNIPGRPEGASAFMTKQNLIGVIFLLVFTINLIAMSVDFPRYSALRCFLAEQHSV